MSNRSESELPDCSIEVQPQNSGLRIFLASMKLFLVSGKGVLDFVKGVSGFHSGTSRDDRETEETHDQFASFSSSTCLNDSHG